ncbi:MAG: type II toxin-antitoxin system VapC family toxin [Janthinobacterium lividum]
MAHLLDSSILLRHTNPSDPLHLVAANAILTLHRQGEVLHTAPQIFTEFRCVVTRPADVNGLGLSSAEAQAKAAIYEAEFPLLLETPELFVSWKALVEAADVRGKQVHDARLIAICQVYGITNILTFNVRHFTRMAAFVPGLVIIDPTSI